MSNCGFQEEANPVFLNACTGRNEKQDGKRLMD
jgi:hypothetical protein